MKEFIENYIAVRAVRVKSLLPYVGLPFICGALFISTRGSADAFSLLLLEILVAISYVAAIIDLRTKRISNVIILALLAAWVSVMAPKLFLDTEKALAMLIDAAKGSALGGGLFLLVYLVSRKGIGGGDVKYMFAAGLYLGLDGTIPSILIGSLLTTLTGLGLILFKKLKRNDSMPLIPFLYIGILTTVFLQSWYT